MKEKTKYKGIFVPGLGADERVLLSFQEKFDCLFFEWEIVKEKEPISGYVQRWVRKQNFLPDFILGVSFGGLIADELKKYFPDARLILVSSFYSNAQSKNWISYLFPLINIKLLRLLKARVFSSFYHYFFSVNEKEQKSLLNQIIQDTDEKFLRWAIFQIGGWKEITHKPDCIIHGNRDRLIPAKETDNLKKLTGGHFIIIQKSAEITSILEETMQKV